MRTTLTLLLVCGFSVARGQNTCATALAITPGLHVVDTVDGTQVPPNCLTAGVNTSHGEWYRYTPSADGGLFISSDLSVNSGDDTRLHIYTGGCGALLCVGGDDDSGTANLSRTTINVSAGTTYHFAWDDYWNANSFTFRLADTTGFLSAVSFNTVQVNPLGGIVRGVVDMNNDGLDDIVAVQSNTSLGITLSTTVHHQLPGGGFQAQTYAHDSIPNRPSWSFCAGDLDGNGYNDMLFAGGSAVSLVFADEQGTGFPRDTTYAQYVFCQRSNMVDINNDGALDAFSCHDVDPNVYFLNEGDGTLSFHQGGLGDTPNGGNYGSIWTDYDNDGDVDLYLSKCRGNDPASINQMHRNNGDGTFTEVGATIGLDQYQQNWSTAIGDLDNDGDMDALVGASSFYTGGHELRRNDGGVFTDVTAGSGWADFAGTSIQHVTHDFDNDGWLDIMGGGGTILMNNGDMTFTSNPVGFEVGAVGDVNNDGFLDMLRDNALRLNAGNDNHWIRVQPVGTVSNRNAIGARVTITTAAGSQVREIRSGDGFTFMSTLAAHFGIGQETAIEEVIVRFPSGIVNTVSNPPIDGTLTIVEEVSTAVSEYTTPALRVHPVPTSGLLQVTGIRARATATVHDMQGRVLHQAQVMDAVLDMSALSPGSYLLQVADADGVRQVRFVRE